MYTIRKKFKFEASHVLDEAFSKDCLNIHGHSYCMEVFISHKELNEDGMVMDFGRVKARIAPIIGEFDHACIISFTNTKMKSFLQENKYKYFVMKQNPTAENMCKYFYTEIFNVLSPKLNYKLKIRLHETETGYAEYTEE